MMAFNWNREWPCLSVLIQSINLANAVSSLTGFRNRGQTGVDDSNL